MLSEKKKDDTHGRRIYTVWCKSVGIAELSLPDDDAEPSAVIQRRGTLARVIAEADSRNARSSRE